jgi:hypothetical protein
LTGKNDHFPDFSHTTAQQQIKPVVPLNPCFAAQASQIAALAAFAARPAQVAAKAAKPQPAQAGRPVLCRLFTGFIQRR